MSVKIFSGGGRIIKDATATPEDVKRGKVFYNNDGRQVGSLNALRKQMIVTPSSKPPTQNIYMNFTVNMYIVNKEACVYSAFSGSGGYIVSFYSLNYTGKIRFIEYDGYKISIPRAGYNGTNRVSYSCTHSQLEIVIDFDTKMIYFGVNGSPVTDFLNMPITLYFED